MIIYDIRVMSLVSWYLIYFW